MSKSKCMSKREFEKMQGKQFKKLCSHTKTIEAAYSFVDKMVERADYHSKPYPCPLWHGWALREAFLEGIKWYILQNKDSANGS